jgi:hypothetical protein
MCWGDERVLDALAALRGLAEAHVGAVQDLVKSYLTRRNALEPLPASEPAGADVRDSLVTVLDVRPPEEHAQGHGLGDPRCPTRQGLAQLPLDVRSLIATPCCEEST